MPKLPSGRVALVSRNVKVDREQWDRAKQIADECDETISDVVRAAVDAYIAKHDRLEARLALAREAVD